VGGGGGGGGGGGRQGALIFCVSQKEKQKKVEVEYVAGRETGRRNITYLNESCHTQECVMAYAGMSHVTRGLEAGKRVLI